MGTENKNTSVVNDRKKPKSKNKQVKADVRTKNNRNSLKEE